MKTLKTFELFDWLDKYGKKTSDKPKIDIQPIKNSSEENVEWEDAFQEDAPVVYKDDDFFEKINDKVRNRPNFENIKKNKNQDRIYAFKYEFERFYLEIYSAVIYYVRREKTKEGAYKRIQLDISPNKVTELFNYMQERIDMYEKAEDRADMEFFQKELSERKRFKTFEAYLSDWRGFGVNKNPVTNTNEPKINDIKNSSEENIEWEDKFHEDEPKVYADQEFFDKLKDKIRNRPNFENIDVTKDSGGDVYTVTYRFERFRLEIYKRSGKLIYARKELKKGQLKSIVLDVDPEKIKELADYTAAQKTIYEEAEDRSDLEFIHKELSERKKI